MNGVRCASAAHLLTISSLLVLSLAWSSTAAPQPQKQAHKDTLQHLVDELQAEVQELKQTIAVLLGGAAPVPGLPPLRASVGQPFVQQIAHTQRTVATKAALWPQHWAFQSAVTADNRVTVAHVMTDRPAGGGGPWCIILGDGAGRLYFFTAQGHLLFEHDTGHGVAVTSLASSLTRSDTSHLAVGLQDASIQLIALQHENLRAPDGSGMINTTTLIISTAADRAAQANSTPPAVDSRPIQHLMFTKSQQRKVLISVDTSGQVVLLAQSSGRVLMTRQLDASPLAVNLNNDFQMIVQTPHAAVLVLMHRGRSKLVRPCSGLAQPAAHAPAATDVVSAAAAASSSSSSRTDDGSSSSSSSDCSLQEDGSCSWDSDHVESQSSAPGIASSRNSSSILPGSSSIEENLEGQGAEVAATAANSGGQQAAAPAAGAAAEVDVLVAAAFDPARSHRVFGVTAGGDLLVLVVPSAQRTNLCKVVQRVPLGLPPGPVRLIATKGRLIILHAAGVAALNTSSSLLKLGAAHIASHTWRDMWWLYGLPWQQQHSAEEGRQRQQQEQQAPGVVSKTNTAVTTVGDSSVRALHSAVAPDGSEAVLAAAAAANLLLLPLGDYGIALFSDTAGPGFVVSGGQPAAAVHGSGAPEASSVDWLRMLQPLVVVMMVGVAAWQFMRASNKNSLMRSRRLDPDGLYGGSGFGSTGLEGLGPSDLGQVGMSAGLFGGGGLPGVDREFGEYAGPRSSRQNNRMTDSLLDMGYGGLNAANARRRARHIMQGRGERELQGVGRSAGVSHGVLGASRQGSAGRQQQQQGFREAGVQPQGQGSVAERQQGLAPLQGVGTSGGQGSAAATVNPSTRRVWFNDNNAEDSGTDDIGGTQILSTPGSGLSSTNYGLEDVSGSTALVAEERVVSPDGVTSAAEGDSFLPAGVREAGAQHHQCDAVENVASGFVEHVRAATEDLKQ